MQGGAGGIVILRLRQDTSATGDDRVSSQHEGALMTGCYRCGLSDREATCENAWQLTRQRRFVDIGRIQRVGRETYPHQQIASTRRGRSKHQPRC